MPRKHPSREHDPRRPTAEQLHDLYKKNGKFRRFHSKKAKREEEKDSGLFEEKGKKPSARRAKIKVLKSVAELPKSVDSLDLVSPNDGLHDHATGPGVPLQLSPPDEHPAVTLGQHTTLGPPATPADNLDEVRALDSLVGGAAKAL